MFAGASLSFAAEECAADTTVTLSVTFFTFNPTVCGVSSKQQQTARFDSDRTLKNVLLYHLQVLQVVDKYSCSHHDFVKEGVHFFNVQISDMCSPLLQVKFHVLPQDRGGQ